MTFRVCDLGSHSAKLIDNNKRNIPYTASDRLLSPFGSVSGRSVPLHWRPSRLAQIHGGLARAVFALATCDSFKGDQTHMSQALFSFPNLIPPGALWINIDNALKCMTNPSEYFVRHKSTASAFAA